MQFTYDDSVFAEGWAFNGEEMLMREGLYDRDPAARRQVIDYFPNATVAFSTVRCEWHPALDPLAPEAY